MTAAHKQISVSDLHLLTPDELLDHRTIARQFVRENGPTGWAYEREVNLLNAINRQLVSVGMLSYAW